MKVRYLKKRARPRVSPTYGAIHFVYPLRRNRKTQKIARIGDKWVTKVVPGLVENDLLTEPVPIDPISKNGLLFPEPLRITSQKQFFALYGSPHMPHVDPPLDVLRDLMWGPEGQMYATRVTAPKIFDISFDPAPDESETLQKWLDEGSAEIVQGSHGTFSIIDASRKD